MGHVSPTARPSSPTAAVSWPGTSYRFFLGGPAATGSPGCRPVNSTASATTSASSKAMRSCNGSRYAYHLTTKGLHMERVALHPEWWAEPTLNLRRLRANTRGSPKLRRCRHAQLRIESAVAYAKQKGYAVKYWTVGNAGFGSSRPSLGCCSGIRSHATFGPKEDLVGPLFNSSEKRLARVLLLLANFGKDSKPEPVIAKISQETLAEIAGTPRSRVSFFMKRFRKLGGLENPQFPAQCHPARLMTSMQEPAPF